ncbi:MAG: DUF4271 domain-containing protein [Hyphomicrobiales bacterium]
MNDTLACRDNPKPIAKWVIKEDLSKIDAFVSDQRLSLNEYKTKHQEHISIQKPNDTKTSSFRLNTEISGAYNLQVILLFISVFFVAFVKYNNKRIKDIFLAPFLFDGSRVLLKEGNLYNEFLIIPLTFNFIIVIAIIFYKLLGESIGNLLLIKNSAINFLIICGIIAITLIFKVIATWLCSKLFDKEKFLHYYTSLLSISISVQGLYLLPLALIMLVYSEIEIFYVALLWLVISFFYRCYQLFRNGVSKFEFSKFHIILYLCSLEFLPLALAIKVFELQK